MNYLVDQILLYLLAAAALGIVLGWMLQRFVLDNGNRAWEAGGLRQLDQARKERDRLGQEVANLTDRLQQVQERHESVATELEAMRKGAGSSPTANEEIHALVDELRKQHEELREQYDEQQRHHDELRQRHDRQRKQYEECIATLENELVEQKRRGATGGGTKRQAATAHDENEIQALQARCQAAEEELRDIETLRAQYEELRTAHAQLLSKVDRDERSHSAKPARGGERVSGVAGHFVDDAEEFTWEPKRTLVLEEPAPARRPKSKTASKPQPEAGSSSKDAAAYPYPIEEIEGIHKSVGARLRALGLQSTEDLLRKCGKPDGLGALAASTGMDVEDLRRWTSMADLMRIDGIRRQQADLLQATGVGSVQDLAARAAEELVERMKQVNHEQRRARPVASPEAVATWIEVAKTTPAMIHPQPSVP